MAQVLTTDPELVNRYLADQLSRAECEALEARLTTDSRLLRELEAIARFKLALSRLRKEDRLDSLLQSRAPRCQWPLAAAAAVALIAIGTNVIHSIQTTRTPMIVTTLESLSGHDTPTLSVGSTYAMFRKRGGAYDALITVPATAQWIGLRVLPDEEASGSAAYRIAILDVRDDGSKHAWASIEGVKPDADGFVSVYIDSARLVSGDYTLDLSGDPAVTTHSLQTFTIKVSATTER